MEHYKNWDTHISRPSFLENPKQEPHYFEYRIQKHLTKQPPF